MGLEGFSDTQKVPHSAMELDLETQGLHLHLLKEKSKGLQSSLPR